MRGDFAPFPGHFTASLSTFFRKLLAPNLKDRVSTIESMKNLEWFREFDFNRERDAFGKKSRMSTNELKDLYGRPEEDQVSDETNSSDGENSLPEEGDERVDTEESRIGLIKIKSVREFSEGRIMGLDTQQGMYSPTKDGGVRSKEVLSSERSAQADTKKSRKNSLALKPTKGPYNVTPKASLKSRTKIDLDEGLLDNLYGKTHINPFNL